MFDYVRNNKRFIQIVLALIVLPFALFGIDAYVSGGGGDGVASVGDTSISVPEFQENLRQQQERMRAQLGGAVPQEMLDSPAMRRAVLQELINQRLMQLYAADAGMRISNEALAGFITSVPGLQENGKFSRERYESLVAAQGMSVEMFEARVRQDMLMQQALMAAGNASLSGKPAVNAWLSAQLEQRNVREAGFTAEQFIGRAAKPDDAAIQRYYEENRARFEKPELVRVEYLVLGQEQMKASAQVSDADIEAAYKANAARYVTPEQRQASHILIRADKNAPAADVKAASEQADQLLAELKLKPGDFSRLAKAHSQDPGSAANGGDLGYFGKGMMVKPFEEAVFALKQDEISPVVRSDFGFHIIKLTGIKAGKSKPLAEVRGEIVAELQNQAAARRYAESAESFSNTVYEQPDSLAPAAEKYGLKVQTSGWLAKSGQQMPPFSNPKLVQAIFSEDAVKNRRNTEAIDTGNNTLVSARVVEHQPAQLEPLANVRPVIEKALLQEAALSLAVSTGEAQLAKLVAGEKAEVSWGNVRNLSRLTAAGMSAEGRQAVFGVSGASLPAHVGARTPGGYALYRIESIKAFDAAAAQEGELAARVEGLRQQYEQALAQQEVLGWISSLRER